MQCIELDCVIILMMNSQIRDLQYLTQITETVSTPGKIYGSPGMVHFAEINQIPFSYSMLQDNGRATTPKLVPRNCHRYLQTTLIMGGRGISLRTYVRCCLKK